MLLQFLCIIFDRNRHFLDPLPREKEMIGASCGVSPTGYRSLYKAAAAVAIDPEVPWFRVWRLGRMGFNISINFLARKCGASTFIGKVPWSN